MEDKIYMRGVVKCYRCGIEQEFRCTKFRAHRGGEVNLESLFLTGWGSYYLNMEFIVPICPNCSDKIDALRREYDRQREEAVDNFLENPEEE